MGKSKDSGSDASSLIERILSTLRSSENGKSMELKALRTDALKGDADKSSKKLFKSAVKQLEKDEQITLSSDGIVKLSKSERTKSKDKTLKKKKDKKRKRESKDKDDKDASNKKPKDTEGSHDEDEEEQVDVEEIEDKPEDQGEDDQKNKNKPCKNNPQGVTRLFVGNLPFKVTEETLNAHLKECVTHVKWITDKETGKFYGSSFVEVRNSKDAAECLSQINGTSLMGRPIKINYAPMRAGEENDWPPRSRVITGGKMANSGGQAGGSGIKALSAKPEGCSKLFIGNVAFDIDDDAITKFFAGVEAELKAVRWLFHKDTGDFKGCGYVDFWNTEACEKAAGLNGKNLLGRPIRIDWTE